MIGNREYLLILNKNIFMKSIRYVYVLAIACFSAFFICMVKVKQKVQGDFFLRNIEALADKKPENKYVCIGEGNVTCPVTGQRVYAVYIQSR